MYYINVELNRYNCGWFFKYLSKNFKNENIYLYLDINSKSVLKKTIYKILKKNNISFSKFTLNENIISEGVLKKLNMFCRKGPLTIFELNSYNEEKLKLINNTALPFILKSNENINFEKIYYYEDEKILNSLFMKFKIPSLSCENTSCLGKTIFIKKRKMSICKKKEFKKGIINESNIIDAVVNSSFTNDELRNAITKRENCKKTCEMFIVCKSGCPCQTNYCIKEIVSNKIILNPQTNLYSEIFLRNNILNINNIKDVKHEK